MNIAAVTYALGVVAILAVGVVAAMSFDRLWPMALVFGIVALRHFAGLLHVVRLERRAGKLERELARPID